MVILKKVSWGDSLPFGTMLVVDIGPIQCSLYSEMRVSSQHSYVPLYEGKWNYINILKMGELSL